MSLRVRSLASCLVLLALAPLGCKRADSHEKTAPPAADSAAMAAPAPTSAQDAASSQFYEVAATAQAARTARLSAKGGGILRKIRVREGEVVKTGQALAQLDTTDIAIRAQSAAVSHAQAVEALRNAKSDLDRANMLFDAGALPDQTIEKAQMGLKMAELQVQAAKVGMQMTQQALADATLVAPFNGVITKVMAEEGQMITQMPPVIVFILADVDTLEVRASIPERRLGAVKVGLPARVILPAVNTEIEAKVDRIAEVIDPMTRSAEVIVRVDNRTRKLPAGLYARLRFPTVPAEASDQQPSATSAPAAGDKRPPEAQPPAPAATSSTAPQNAGR